MKKGTVCKLLFLIAGLLAAGFCVKTIVEYLQYSTTLNSAPFSVFVLANAIEFFVPGILCAVTGLFLKQKNGGPRAGCQ